MRLSFSQRPRADCPDSVSLVIDYNGFPIPTLHNGRNRILPFRPIRDNLQDLPHVRAFTPGRARPELTLVQAVPGALRRALQAVREHRAIVEVAKVTCRDAERRSTRVIEIKQAERQLLEVGLISDESNIGIGQHVVLRSPNEAAGWARLERGFFNGAVRLF